MPSYLDEMLNVFDSLAASLAKLEQADFSAAQLKELLATAGSRTEVFLKAAALPSGKSRRDFVALIDEAGAAGLEARHVQALHVLRREYNAAKHDPTYEPTIAATRTTLTEARQSLERIGFLGMGKANTQRPVPLRRVFWIFATDHYIGGDTEISIAAPADNGRGIPLDTIYIAIPEWEPALTELATLGHLRMGTSNLPPGVVDWYGGEDFIGAGVFEGTYRDLLTVFAKRELRQQLLPGLNRHDDLFSILQSAVLATVDIMRSATAVPDVRTLSEDIVSATSSDYAVPADAHGLEKLAMELARCVSTVPPRLYPSLTGPSWVTREELARLEATAFCARLDVGFVLDEAGVFRLPLS